MNSSQKSKHDEVHQPHYMSFGAMESSGQYAYASGNLVLLPSTEEYKSRRACDSKFLEACKNGNLEYATAYLSLLADEASYGYDDEDRKDTPKSIASQAFALAVEHRHLKVLTELIKTCYLDFRAFDEAITEACGNDDLELVKLLLRYTLHHHFEDLLHIAYGDVAEFIKAMKNAKTAEEVNSHHHE